MSSQEPVFKLDKETGEYVEIAPKLVAHGPAVDEDQKLTIERLKEYMPKKFNGTVTQAVLDEIHRIEDDTGLPQNHMEEVIVSNMHLLSGSGKTLRGLVDATKFANLSQYMDQKKAWQITFPDRYQKLVERGATPDSHASMYAKSQLVVDILKTMIIASNITLQPQRAAAIQVLVNQMNGIGANDDQKVSSLVSFNAASKIVDMTEMDKDNSIELKLGVSEAAIESQNNLADQIGKMAELQMAKFQESRSIRDVQKIDIVIGEDEIIDE